MNAESEIGNSGRRVGSCSLLRGGRGCDNVVPELWVAALGLYWPESVVKRIIVPSDTNL